MRRPLTTAAVVITLLVGTACSSERDGVVPVASGQPAAGTASPSESPASAGGAPPDATPVPAVTATAGGNAASICPAVIEANSEGARTYVTELGKMLQAEGDRDTAAAKSAAKRVEAALKSWSETLRTQSAKATDAELKAALAELATEVAGLEPDIASIDESQLERVQQRVDQLCGS
jgi:hypothetical protein